MKEKAALLARLRDLHTQTWESTADEVWKRPGVCSHDGFAWPCDTIRAVDEHGSSLAASSVACQGHFPACTHTQGHIACNACISKRMISGPLYCVDLDNCAGPGCMDEQVTSVALDVPMLLEGLRADLGRERSKQHRDEWSHGYTYGLDHAITVIVNAGERDV